MRTLFIATLTLLLTSVLAQSQEAVIAFACNEQGHAEALAGEMTEQNVMNADERWSTCRPIGKPIGSMDDAPLPLMVLKDWEDDIFALYAAEGAFFIVYWVNGYKPAGQSL
jgi:hypothetical protein